jgi:hypothetical protein
MYSPVSLFLCPLQSLKVTSRFRAFGHLYSALRDRELMPPLPLADQLLTMWDRMIFYPSRPTVGQFGTTYQVLNPIILY